jgi:MFS family permease
MSLAIFVLAVNTSALVNALPVICIQYNMEVSNLQWIMNVYMLAAAAFILIGGRLGDIFNRKKLFLFFSILYSLSSLMIALIDSASVLFTGRLVQGICAAFVTSGSLVFVKLTFDPRRLSLAFGLWSGLVGLGCAIGPFLGGILTDIISWKAIFWLNFIVMGVVIYFLHFRFFLLPME